MITRKLGKVLRGKATTPQILMATTLGGLLGFVPGFILVGDLGGGFMQAPGLILALLFLVLVLNANMAVFGVAMLLAKLVSLPLMALSFEVGRFLLDGPTQGLFAAMINAPVLAWFGFEHYATTGGLLVGLLFGVGSGLLLVRALRIFRARMAQAEEGSERYQKLTSKRSVRFLTWLFLGKGKGKRSYRELLESKKKGLPIRIPGVVVVVIATVGIWIGHSLLSGPYLRNALQNGLEQWNGATVDLAEARIDLGAGQAVLAGLGVTDPQQLARDAFQARTLDLKIGTRDLLQKRLVIDTITSREASTGAQRATPGKIVYPTQAPPPPPPAKEPGAKTLEDYLAEAEKWKERLQQVNRWMEKLAGGDEGAAEETPEQRDERIEQAAAQYGLARVTASHLIEEAPLLLVRELVFDGVTAVDLGGDLLDVHAKNLSTNPSLVADPMELSITSRSGRFSFAFRVDAAGAQTATTEFTFKDLQVDDVAAALKVAPLRGGTMDLSLTGSLDCARPEGVWLDLPLQVRLHDTTLTLQGMPETAVDDLLVPLGLRGPLASPRVSLDDQVLADALVAAGRAELANQVRARASALLGDRLPGVGDDIGNLIDGQKTPAELLDEAKKKAEAEARAKAEAEAKKLEEEAKKKAAEEAKKILPGGLPGGGLFGGKKK